MNDDKYLNLILQTIKDLPTTVKPEMAAELVNLTTNGKRFVLDIEPSIKFYNDTKTFGKIHTKKLLGNFVPPFDTCLIAFKNPFPMRLGTSSTEGGYQTLPVIGLGLHSLQKIPWQTKFVPELTEEITFQEEIFRVSFFVMRSSPNEQFWFEYGIVRIKVLTLIEKGVSEVIFLQEQHKCQAPEKCNVLPEGTDRKTEGRQYVCEDVIVRDCMCFALYDILFRLNYKETTIEKTSTQQKKSPEITFNNGSTISLPTKIPTENYISPLNTKTYKYEPEGIARGTGTAHRFQYDVRRHPRIIGNKIVWINPYKRGEGEYIQKVYTNSGTWLINYTLRYTEKLTKYRWFEVLLIQTIKLIRRFH